MKEISITENQFNIIMQDIDCIVFENKKDLLMYYLRDYLEYGEENNLLELISDIVLNGRDYMQEILNKEDIYEVKIKDKVVYICIVDDLHEIVNQLHMIENSIF